MFIIVYYYLLLFIITIYYYLLLFYALFISHFPWIAVVNTPVVSLLSSLAVLAASLPEIAETSIYQDKLYVSRDYDSSTTIFHCCCSDRMKCRTYKVTMPIILVCVLLQSQGTLPDLLDRWRNFHHTPNFIFIYYFRLFFFFPFSSLHLFSHHHFPGFGPPSPTTSFSPCPSLDFC